ncbi:MAG TPA: hypothetical protein VFW83_09400, partial [Bryobacteraceae bacterium]|nr:hypothetical protein [Bryobacteraceae bacterium]
QKPDVTGAIDRYLARATFSGPLAQTAIQVSGVNDAWFATAVPPSTLIPGNNPNVNNSTANNLLQSVLQTSGGVKFASDNVIFSAQAVTRSAQDAQSLIDVLKFLASTVQTNRDRNPGAARAATLADNAMFTTNGDIANVTVTVPETQVERLLMPAVRRTRRVAERKRK